MNKTAIHSVKHFVAFHQIVDDYKLLVFYEQELESQNYTRKKFIDEKTKKEIIFLLERIILNKKFLLVDNSADVDYLKKIKINETDNI
jgi:hypothetical protein